MVSSPRLAGEYLFFILIKAKINDLINVSEDLTFLPQAVGKSYFGMSWFKMD